MKIEKCMEINCLVENELLKEMVINEGVSLMVLFENKLVLLVFFWYFGCIFCWEVFVDIFKEWEDIEVLGFELVFVYMIDNEVAECYFNCYGLEGV